MAVIARPAVQRLSRFSLTTAGADDLAAFYENTFGCRRLATEYLSGSAFESLMGVTGGALRITLSLGGQIVELLQFDHPGKPYPDSGSASDLIFQHFAIVVSDMGEAYRRLSATDAWTAISRGGPQRLPESSGGVTAFKFRDPEGHPLELLAFGQDAMPPNWRNSRPKEIFLGIDHSAISISDTARSIAFYESLGLKTSKHMLNHGSEQEKLDGIGNVALDITVLLPLLIDPHLELLCYRGVLHGPGVLRSNADIATTRLIFETDDRDAPHDFADPDGHHLIFQTAVGRTP